MLIKKLSFIQLILLTLLVASCGNELLPSQKEDQDSSESPDTSNPLPNPNENSNDDNPLSAPVRPSTNPNVQDPLYKYQWHLKNTGQFGGTSGVDINVEPVWEQGYTGKGIKIAVLDDALRLSEGEVHEDLRGNLIASKSHNFYGLNGNHGLRVSGVIAARDNHLGGRGVAFRSKLYTYGILHQNKKDSDTIDALTRNISEIAVSNNSWGEVFGVKDGYVQAWQKGLRDGFGGKGTVYVFGAGNTRGVNTSARSTGNFYGLVVVNALDKRGGHANFSGFPFYSIGSNLWISAPGDQITTTSSENTLNPNEKYTGTFAATSSATPIVSGVIALMREANPNLTWRDVKLILAESAVQNDPSHSGWKQGLPKKSKPSENFYFNHHYGFGMVNAFNAVNLAKTWVNLPPMKTEERSASVSLNIDGTAKSDTISISTSDVQFIESVTVELDFDKKTNVEETRKFDLQLSHDGIVSHLYMEGKWLHFNSRMDGFANSHHKNQIQLTMLTNAHLGQSAAGTWTITVKDTDVFTKLKNWKLIIRGH